MVKAISLPAEVAAVFANFRTCEFSTLARDGTPITWPVVSLYRPAHGHFQLTTSIGFPSKVHNIRRNPRVSMLFSEPTGSGLERPPAVLVQGMAAVSDQLVAGVEGMADYWRDIVFSRQPGSAILSNNPISRAWMDWYFIRWVITVRPVAIRWWPGGDFARPAQVIEVDHVA